MANLVDPTALATDIILCEAIVFDLRQISRHDPTKMPDMKIEVCPHP
jgi:hypothetical protein